MLKAGEKPRQESEVLLELQAGFDLSGGAELEMLCECEGLLENSDDEGMAGSHVDESIAQVGEELLALLAEERGEVLDSTETVHEGSMHRCPFCPFRQFPRPSRVMEHVQKYHTTKRQFCCSGTKQVRVIQALFDDDQLRNIQPSARYLRRSAAVLRTSIGNEDGSINHLDRRLRLVLTEKGPVYKSLQHVAENETVYRRAKNLYYTHGFADMLFQEMMVSNAKMKQASRLKLVDMYPLDALFVAPLNCDIDCFCYKR